jgi:hypothetical protein
MYNKVYYSKWQANSNGTSKENHSQFRKDEDGLWPSQNPVFHRWLILPDIHRNMLILLIIL